MRDSSRLALKFFGDLALWSLMTPVAFWIRSAEPWLFHSTEMLVLFAVGIPVKAGALYLLRFHSRSWHRIGIRDLYALIKGVVAVMLVLAAAGFFLPHQLNVPRGVPLIEGMLSLLVLGSTRLAIRLFDESRRKPSRNGSSVGKRIISSKRVLIAGAGEAGTMIAREMLRHPEAGLEPIGFLDDDAGKRRQTFLGLPVLGSIDALPDLAEPHRVDEIIIAMPSEAGEAVRHVVNVARRTKVRHRIIPGIYDLLSGKVAISQIREVDVEDLLRREPVRLDVSDIQGYVSGRTVLITGAGGSIGAEIVRQIIGYHPERIILLGRGENSIYEVEQECRHAWPDVATEAVIADVRDRDKVRYTFERYRPQVIFHAAAHKHVPLMEANPDEAVLNNVCGTKNVADMALEYGVQRFVNISTDKAVNPSSVMGASKRVAEYMVERAARRAGASQQFVSVRFGNVLGSRGSVIPLFKKQIQRGGPVTITHPEMQRYFMTIPEAVQLVLQAGGLGENGTVYVLDMGAPVRIADLARDLILLSGLEPDVDIPLTFTGTRAGEKLFEELMTAEEGTLASRHEKIFMAHKNGLPDDLLDTLVPNLVAAAADRDGDAVRAILREIIPSYAGAPAGVEEVG